MYRISQLGFSLSVFALSLAALASVSCSKADMYDNYGCRIRINASTNRAAESKSGASAELRGVYAAGSGGLVLEEYVSDYGFLEESGTKGAVITDSRTTVYPSNHNPITSKTINLEAWLHSSIDSKAEASQGDKDNHHFISGETVTYGGSKWNTGSVNYWRDGIASSFWSYVAPAVGNLNIAWPANKPSNDDALRSINFSYSLPDPGTSADDANTLQDFLFAYNEETRNINPTTKNLVPGQTDYFNIHFYHPLAAVKFNVGTISGASSISDDEYVNITKVEIVDVAQSGSFTATGSASGVAFACTPSSTKKTYSQAATREQIENGLFTSNTSDYVFFMIPQNVDNVKVKLTMTRKKKNSDGTYSEDRTEFYREVSLSGNWEAGKYYTYRINSTVYFGGEEVHLDPTQIESSSGITVDNLGNMSFSISGTVSGWDNWVAPLPCKGVNVLKLTINHHYKNNNQASQRLIWLENATLNPDWYEGSSVEKYLNPENLDTRNAELVAEAKNLSNADDYWTNKHYTGILGETTQSGKAYNKTSYDNNMNNASEGDFASTMYFYLGGRFDYVKIHFGYDGATGGGSINWSATLPSFNITEVVE